MALVSINHASAQRLAGDPWPRFAIDDQHRGADGVKIADINLDGLPDLVTGWEESGITKVYLHPGTEGVTQRWPTVKVGDTPNVEDAAWCDVNRDGRLDVITCCEGKEQSVKVHIAPQAAERILEKEAWTTKTLPATKNLTRWMFAAPFPSKVPFSSTASGDDDSPVRIVVGSKMPGGMIGLLSIRPKDDDAYENAELRKLCDASWIMSILPIDLDGDTDLDIVFTDRKQAESGVYWIENPGSLVQSWKKHLIGLPGAEVMFMQEIRSTRLPSLGSQKKQLVVAVKPDQIVVLTAPDDPREPWGQHRIAIPNKKLVGTAKAVAWGDLTGDKVPEFVYSCESAVGRLRGLVYLRHPPEVLTTAGTKWTMHDISGNEGTKFDLIELIDLDRDGDLDVLTCEERYAGKGLGLVWYANPQRSN